MMEHVDGPLTDITGTTVTAGLDLAASTSVASYSVDYKIVSAQQAVSRSAK